MTAGSELVDEVAGILNAAMVCECNDRVVDCRHPRVELLVETSRKETDVSATHGHEGSIDGESFVAALLDDLIEPSGDCHDRFARAGSAIESDHGDIRIE